LQIAKAVQRLGAARAKLNCPCSVIDEDGEFGACETTAAYDALEALADQLAAKAAEAAEAANVTKATKTGP
jgi:hypothetical protein